MTEKNCLHCGAKLPEEAHFCPFCITSQIEKNEVRIPVPKKKQKITAILLIAAALFAILLIRFLTTPKTWDTGEAELRYEINGTVWHLLIRTTGNDEYHWMEAQPVYIRILPAGTQAAIPLQLYVYDEADASPVSEAFLDALADSEIVITPQGDASAAQSGTPYTNPAFPRAVLETDIVYDTDCSANRIDWIFHMKNQDTLVLHVNMEIKIMPEVSYTWENTPLSTTEELQAFLDTLAERTDPDTAVTITLAPVAYEGDIRIEGHAVSLCGSADQNTVMKGSLKILSDTPVPSTVSGLTFEGKKAGISAEKPVIITDCRFVQTDCGVAAREGAWPMLYGCFFQNCGTGLYFNSGSATSRSALFENNSFVGNETAVLLERVPGDDVLYFVGCIFEGNQTDIDNRTGNGIRYTPDDFSP